MLVALAFCGKILAQGGWNLQMSWYKCPGVPLGQHPGMAADKCIKLSVILLGRCRCLTRLCDNYSEVAFAFSRSFLTNIPEGLRLKIT